MHETLAREIRAGKRCERARSARGVTRKGIQEMKGIRTLTTRGITPPPPLVMPFMAPHQSDQGEVCILAEDFQILLKSSRNSSQAICSPTLDVFSKGLLIIILTSKIDSMS